MHICALSCYKIVHHGIWNWCIVGFVWQVYSNHKDKTILRLADYSTVRKHLYIELVTRPHSDPVYQQYALCLRERLRMQIMYGDGAVLTGWYIPTPSQNHLLTHLPLDNMDAISQTTFSNAFLWLKNVAFWFKFCWSLFLIVQLTISQHWIR